MSHQYREVIENVTMRQRADDFLLMFYIVALFRVVCEIFNVENIATLKSWSKVTQGHSGTIR